MTPSFRKNVAAIILFYMPSGKTMKAIFKDYVGEMSHEQYKQGIHKLKEHKYSFMVFSLRHPFKMFMHSGNAN